MKTNLKLLYFLTLGALFLYMITGPALASSVSPEPIINTGVSVANVQGLPENFHPAWASPGYGTTVSLGLNATCGTGGGSCSATVDFWFNLFNPAQVTISLNGSSTDPNATGTVGFDGTTQGWTVSNSALVMAPFTVSVPGSEGAYEGYFTIASLAPGQTVYIPTETSLDFTTNLQPSSAPEPGSVLLLGGGIAFVVFLRRKIRA